MMKSPPAAALVVAEPKVLLEVLVIMLDTPTHLGRITTRFSGVCSGSVDSQYLSNSVSTLGHSISRHSGSGTSSRSGLASVNDLVR